MIARFTICPSHHAPSPPGLTSARSNSAFIDTTVAKGFSNGEMTDIHLREAGSSQSPKTKPPPETAAIPVPFTYHPSDDGTDENLLIFLHGLGAYLRDANEETY